MKGLVFDIQRYSIHDGPGIRTVVFLKGCPLRCKWCSNPESQDIRPQIFYIKSRCMGCGLCEKNCPDKEVKLEHDGLKIDWKAANRGDLAWTSVCPTGALGIKGIYMSVEEVLNIVMKDEIFYRQSGGGMTLSGGEPLMQPKFALGLLKMAREADISTAVETTGYVDRKVLLDAMHYTDVFLYDFKHWDDEAHIKYTGVSNKKIKDNLKILAEAGANIMVRTPLIPDVNDSEESIRKIMEIIKEYGIKKFTLLPFHQYGSGKYASCGMQYDMKDVKPHSEKQVAKLFRIIEDSGFSSEF
ncbi:MAG: glycyl-radical enzyme activating protein [Clostridiaceae bacterium]|nr:glycyl-radical enzyme activating protein [Clostridiaceae bacterium]